MKHTHVLFGQHQLFLTPSWLDCDIQQEGRCCRAVFKNLNTPWESRGRTRGGEVLIWTVSLVPSTSNKSENIADGLLFALWPSESSSHQTCPLILDQPVLS